MAIRIYVLIAFPTMYFIGTIKKEILYLLV